MTLEQLPLFPKVTIPTVPLTRDSSLITAIVKFQEYMRERGFSEHTFKAFLSDLRIFAKYIGASRPIGEIGTEDLNDFLNYLLYYRGVPCNRKSYARRVTTLKVFFRWLNESGIIPHDPAAPLIHLRVKTPLPQILYEGQVRKLLSTTRRLMEEGDPRPHLLITLILSTGIKKGECMDIKLNHIDLSDPSSPVLYIRYTNPKMAHKERKLKLPSDFTPTFRRYIKKYKPKKKLFECTARNLEYVLDNVAELSGIENISFEMLRWTCAVRDHKEGMPSEKLRRKLGLSKISWKETSKKIEKLAGPAL
jgi:integrase/recombinase XerD